MVKLIDKISDEVLAYMAIAMAFMLAGSNIGGATLAFMYGVEYKPEFAFLAQWTASPIAMLIFGIVSMVLGVIAIYFLVKDQKKEES